MIENRTTESALFLKPTRTIVNILLVIFLLGGLGIRLIDLTDLPLDFAATRQLHSYIMARGFYYQMDTPATRSIPSDIREFGIGAGKAESQIEPPIVEYLAAITYGLMGSESMLVARLYSILFWVIGGIPLFLLARKLTSINGAFVALSVYLFNPFGTIASRSFQPDPLMVMLMLWALYFQFEWAKNDTLKLALLTGIFTGLTVFVKMPAVFFVGVTLVGIVLSKGLRQSLRNRHVYLIAAISLLPALAFNIISATIGGNAGAIFGVRWVPVLFSDPKWYLKWLMLARLVVGFYPIVIALLGFFFIKDKTYRLIYFCLWLGYILYGFMFAYHIYTHNYYHLPLIPIISLGFGAVAAVIFEQLETKQLNWFYHVLVMGLFLFSIGLNLMKSRGDLIGSSYRHEAKYWKDLGELIGQGNSVIGLTHDYGARLNYWGFIQPDLWPTQGDLVVKELIGSTDPEFISLFNTRTESKRYFLVTLLPDFESQENLYQYLFATFAYQEGDGYYLFDLENPLVKEPQP